MADASDHVSVPRWQTGVMTSKASQTDTALSMAVERYRQGDMASAKEVLEALLEVDPDNADALHHLGLIAHFHKQEDAAVALIMQAIRLCPANHRCHYNLGMIWELQEKHSDAIECYDTVLRLAPECREAYLRIARLYQRTHRYKEAIHLMSDALQRFPDDSAFLNRTAAMLNALNSPNAATPFLRRALEKDPTNVFTRLLLSDSLKSLGRIDESKRLAHEVVEIAPDTVYAYCSLSEDETFPRGDPVFDLLERTVVRDDLTRTACKDLHFALGKMYGDTGEYDRSFEHFAAGHTLRREINGPFDREGFVHRLETLKRCFTRDFYRNHSPRGSDSERPVFIVGMPRSGTSLVEQILASHPEVFGAGELSLIPAVAPRLFAPNNPEASLAALTPATLGASAGSYLHHLESIAGDERYVTDKMPVNQLHLWLIALLFPRSRVIHCTREPMDNCLACYIRNFSHPHQYVDDLADLGLFYRQSEQLMTFWKEHTGLAVLDVSYERMVSDTETMVGVLLDFCDLAWDERCLAFHQTRRSVTTASRTQVRKKIYTSSVGRWKRYRAHLAPLIEAIGLPADKGATSAG